VGWFDLLDPAAWPALAVSDSITYPMLQRIRAALGYASHAGDLAGALR
jgi:hypothetical protein